LPIPAYLHTPLVLGVNGEKLSKQNGALALDLGDPLAALNAAAWMLGMPARHSSGEALTAWAQEWRALYNPAGERNKPD
jgi:glutamyl-Q tRNA(Asp) synthetase